MGLREGGVFTNISWRVDGRKSKSFTDVDSTLFTSPTNKIGCYLLLLAAVFFPAEKCIFCDEGTIKVKAFRKK